MVATATLVICSVVFPWYTLIVGYMMHLVSLPITYLAFKKTARHGKETARHGKETKTNFE